MLVKEWRIQGNDRRISEEGGVNRERDIQRDSNIDDLRNMIFKILLKSTKLLKRIFS